MNQNGRRNDRPRPRDPMRRNFGDDSVQAEEREKKRQHELDLSFQQRFGHYFLHREIRKKRLQFESDEAAFWRDLGTDPEMMIRDKLEAEAEVQKNDLVLRGRMYAQKWLDQYNESNFETDDEGIQHFKPNDIESIEIFNENFEENNKIYEAVRSKLEDMLCNTASDRVILENRKKKKEIIDGKISSLGIQNTIDNYDTQITKLEKKKTKGKIKQSDTLDSSRSTELDRKIERIKLKKEVVNDLVDASSDRKKLFNQEWFERNKNNLDEYNKRYGVEKYSTARFKYDRNYQHFFVFIPSGGGKTTLATKYSRYLADIDDFIQYENNEKKLLYLSGYSQFTGDWKVNNNYWQEMFLTYEYKLRNRIVLCHTPDMLPEGTITSRNQSFIILPSVKKWNLRFFKDNYNSLRELKHGYTTVSLHYRYYFYVIYNFFFMYDEPYKFNVVELG